MFNLKENLLSIGLTEEEITVYLATLQPDNETVLKLSQNTTIPRTTVYLLIESLLQKGFIQEVTEGKKKKYIPAPPEKIISYVTSKKQQFSEISAQLQKNIPSIQALYNFHHSKPILAYYEGSKGIVSIMQSTFTSDEVCLHIMSNEGSEILSEEIEDYRSNLQQKMILSREIVSDSLTDRQYVKTYANARNQVRFLPHEYSTNVDYILYSEGMIMITYKNNSAMAVCIKDKHIAQFEKVRFNLLWDHPLLKADNK